MPARTVVLTVPENLYERLEAQAQLSEQPVDKLVLQNLSRNLPPTGEEDLPQALRAELAAMAYLSDDALWPIAQSNMNRDKVLFTMCYWTARLPAILRMKAANG